MSTLHIGKKRVVTLTASDSSTIAAGTVAATPSGPQVTLTVNATTNEVTATGVVAGTNTVTCSAPGYQSVQVFFDVQPLPTLIATVGPEQ